MHVLGNMYTQVFVVATAKVTKTNKTTRKFKH